MLNNPGLDINSGNGLLCAIRQEAINFDNVEPVLCHHGASLDKTELMNWGIDFYYIR